VEPYGTLNPIPRISQQKLEGFTNPPFYQYTAENIATNILIGAIQRLGDFIDTDMGWQFSLSHVVYLTNQILTDREKLAITEFLVSMIDNKSSGIHCLQYTHPVFCDRVG
jgi:hypothetical protein